MNICLVGYGSIAEKHMEAFSKIGNIRPYVLVGRREGPTAEFARNWGFTHTSFDLNVATADPQVDAVVITSPSELHAGQAEAALRAGKHVLLEIPLAMNFADAKRITELARQVDRRLMACHTMRYLPALKEVQRRIASGSLHLHHMIGFLGLLRRNNTSWTGRQRSWTDNILWHHAAHLVDLALWVSGCHEPGEVRCRFGPLHPTQGVMDTMLSMVLSDRILVNISLSYNFSDFRWRALFIGEEETLEFEDGALLDVEGKVIVPQQTIVDLHRQNQEFIDAIAERRDPSTTGEDVLSTMQVLEQAQASADAADG